MSSNLPNYREAYPRFDIIRAKAAGGSVPSGCLFKWRRATLGQLIVPDRSESSLLIAYTLGGPYFGFGNGEFVIQTRPVPNKVHPGRRAMLCPECEGPRFTIYFKHVWACAECHELLHRSQVVERVYLEWERLDRLRTLTSSGRPKGMHNVTYDNLIRRRHELEDRLSDSPRKYAMERYVHECSSAWVPLEDFGEFWIPGYSLFDGQIQRIER